MNVMSNWCDLTFIELSVVKLDYGKVSAIGTSGCDTALLISGAARADLRYRPVDLGESTWSSRHFGIQFEALFGFMTQSECFQKHSLYS